VALAWAYHQLVFSLAWSGWSWPSRLLPDCLHWAQSQMQRCRSHLHHRLWARSAFCWLEAVALVIWDLSTGRLQGLRLWRLF
jgi:hypothetical protein